MRTLLYCAGWAAALAVRAAAGAPDAAGPAGLAAAYAAHLRATRGIADIRTLHPSAIGTNAVEVVIVSAGFTAAEKEAFLRAAAQTAKSILSLEPWRRYRNAVNIHAVLVADESVARSRLGVSGYDGHVLGCNDALAVEYAEFAADAAATLVLHNSGFATASSGTWGVAALNRSDAYNPGAPIHELGHGLAGLGDEYIQRAGPFNEPPESLQDTVDVTAEPNPRLCKWHYWTEESWPGLFKWLPRPPGRVIANFEGAGWPTKIYRPEETCMMRGDRDCFCVVCNETMEANFFRNMGLFATAEPAGEDLVLWRGEARDFRVRANAFIREPPAGLVSRLELFLDGRRVAASDRGDVAYHFAGRAARPGLHQLGASLNIQNDLVRRDFGFLSGCRAWRVRVMPCAQPRLVVAPLLSVPPDGQVDVPVTIQHDRPALFALRMTGAPPNAVLEQGRFKWRPAGATGAWRVDFTAALDGQAAATASLELRVARPDGAAGRLEVQAPATVEAVTGARAVVQVKARAADGSHLLFEPVAVPAGVALDRDTGELAWTPQRDQAGPQLLRLRVRSGDAAREQELLVRVRRAAKPSLVSFCNTYIPDTQQYLKQLAASPVLYRRMFETLRLLRDRYAAVHGPALAAAKALFPELPPELQENGLEYLSLHAWAFTDKPGVLQWLRSIAAGRRSESARGLVRKLDLMAELQALRTLETAGGPADLTPLTAQLLKASDPWVRASIERAVAAIGQRAADKAACAQAVLAAMARVRGAERAALLPLLPLTQSPAAMDALAAAARDADRRVAAQAVQTLAAAGGPAQLAPLVSLLAETRRAADRDALEQAAAAICRRADNQAACQQVILPVLARARGPARAALVRLLPVVPTPAAMAAWQAAARDADRQVARAARQALDYLQGLGGTEGFIAAWQVAGPFVSRPGDACFDEAFAPEQPGGKASWKPCMSKAESGARVVPLGQLFGGNNRVAYLRAVIRSDLARAVRFAAGSDDGLKVWLNGSLLHAHNAMRPLKPDEDRFTGRLNAGDNVLLCKIVQYTGDWSACVRILAADGGAALGVRVAPVPESPVGAAVDDDGMSPAGSGAHR